MKIKTFTLNTLALIGIFLFHPQDSCADYQQRFSLGAGVMVFNNPSQTVFEVLAEYEYRLEPMIGIGGFGNYLFTTPGITRLGAPEFFFHPFSSEFYVSASPMVEFGSGIGTNLGLRLGTRIPLPLGPISLIPMASMDIISGGPDFIFGLGIQF